MGEAWTTLTRCPQAHSHNSNRQVLSRDGTKDRRRQRFQLRKQTRWSRRSSPLQAISPIYHQTTRHVRMFGRSWSWTAAAVHVRRKSWGACAGHSVSALIDPLGEQMTEHCDHNDAAADQ